MLLRSAEASLAVARADRDEYAGFIRMLIADDESLVERYDDYEVTRNFILNAEVEMTDTDSGEETETDEEVRNVRRRLDFDNE